MHEMYNETTDRPPHRELRPLHKKDVPLLRWLNEEWVCLREGKDLVLCKASSNYPQMHVLFSHPKLWLIAMRLFKELYLNLINTWLKVSNCRETLCKQLVKG